MDKDDDPPSPGGDTVGTQGLFRFKVFEKPDEVLISYAPGLSLQFDQQPKIARMATSPASSLGTFADHNASNRAEGSEPTPEYRTSRPSNERVPNSAKRL